MQSPQLVQMLGQQLNLLFSLQRLLPSLRHQRRKVYNRIAEIIDDADSYDGMPRALFHSDTCLMIDYFQTVRMALFSYDSPDASVTRKLMWQ